MDSLCSCIVIVFESRGAGSTAVHVNFIIIIIIDFPLIQTISFFFLIFE